MQTGKGSALRMSWLGTALAALLAITTPVAARMTTATGEASRLDAVSQPVRAARPAPVAVRLPGESAQQAAEVSPEEVAQPARAAFQPHLLVHARAGLVARRNPWPSSPSVGTVASVSRYYKVPLVLWVEEVSKNGEWGLVELPYAWPRRVGWIPLKGLDRESTLVTVRVDLSEHTVRVFKRGELLYRVAGATGAPSSPTPVGEYFVTDRVPFAKGNVLGSFAFGISGIQPNLPAGWSGGDQLAIHGTNNPSSIGKSVSAGCVRVSEWALAKFKPLLKLGTPVLIQR